MHKKILALFLAAAMGLSLVACGGTTGESSDTASDSAATSDAAADAADDTASGETIKIGFLTPMSGANATYGLQVKAAGEMMASVINEEHPEMAVALAKEAGLPNLNGAKIELVFADSKQDPTTAASEAKRLITEQGVVAMTGQYTSAVTKAVAVVTETYGIPLLTAGSSPTLTAPETGLEWYFRFGPNDNTYIEDSFKYLKELNDTQDAGIKTVANVSSEVLRIKTANPDVIFMASYSSDAILYLKTFKEQNYAPKMILGQRGGFIQTDFLDTMAGDTEYICTTAGWSSDLETEASQQLVELYKDFTPDGAELSEGHVKDLINVLLLGLAINQAGTTEPEQVREALRNLDVDTSTLPIPWNGISIDEYGQNTSANSFIVQMTDGNYRTVYPTENATVDVVFPMPNWSER